MSTLYDCILHTNKSLEYQYVLLEANEHFVKDWADFCVSQIGVRAVRTRTAGNAYTIRQCIICYIIYRIANQTLNTYSNTVLFLVLFLLYF
jgi:hypothetical protein